MKKLLILPFLLFLLAGCTTNGVDNDLYNDGKAIIQMTNDNIKNGIEQYSDNQKMKVDNFRAKYLGKETEAKNARYATDIEMAILGYLGYGSNHEQQYLDKYHEYIDKLNKDYNINVN